MEHDQKRTTKTFGMEHHQTVWHEHEQKIWAAAAILLKRHGQKAPEVARQWSRDFTAREDPEAASMSVEIADAANEILTEGITPSSAREPALTDILSGAVTGEMMRADRVERRDVERLMTKTKRRRK
jgi:hypothetical protein